MTRKEKGDWSWLREEHLEDLKDIAGLAFHARNFGSFAGNLDDGWTHDKNNNATFERVPAWGGPCTVVYNAHNFPHNSSDIRPNVITLEGILWGKNLRAHEDMELSVTKHEYDLTKNNINTPTYFVDVGPGFAKDLATTCMALFVEVGVVANGLNALANAPATLGTSALAYYLASGLTAAAGSIMGQAAGGTVSNFMAALTKTQNEIPTVLTLLLLKVRNVLAAEKNEHLARLHSERLGRPVHLATVWGAGHQGIEAETLRSSAERIAFLKRWKPLIKLLFAQKSDPSFLWTCVRVIHGRNGDSPRRIVQGPHVEVPSLKKLFSD